MKKYFLLAAMVGVALTGCVSNEPDLSGGGEKEITFSTPVVGASTRAQVYGELGNGDLAYPAEELFNVYAVWHQNDFSGWNNGSLYMDDVQTKFDDTFNGWRAQTRYYWPHNGGKLTFAAYSPSGLTGVTYGTTGFTFVGYNTGVNTGYVDVLYSDRSYNKTASSANSNTPYAGVDIDFKHALSSIQFTAKKADSYGDSDANTTNITITKISVYGVYNQADFNENIDETAPATYSATPAWTSHTNYGTLTGEDSPHIYYNGSLLLDANKKVMNGIDNQVDLILMPQTLPASAAVKIEYTIDSPGENTPAIPQTHIVMLNDTSNNNTAITTEWKPGKRYTYNITIGLTEIYFSPEIAEWDDNIDDTEGADEVTIPQV